MSVLDLLMLHIVIHTGKFIRFFFPAVEEGLREQVVLPTCFRR